jgi:hypothetical protein
MVCLARADVRRPASVGPTPRGSKCPPRVHREAFSTQYPRRGNSQLKSRAAYLLNSLTRALGDALAVG